MNQEILLVIPGAGDESTGHQAVIEPETTVADLLRAAGLNPTDWQLQVKQGENLVSLGAQDRIADYTHNGDKVHAFPTNMVVGTTA